MDGVSEAGLHEVPFDTSQLAAGACFCRLYTLDAVRTTKLTVLR